jgi:hypothetical protein
MRRALQFAMFLLVSAGLCAQIQAPAGTVTHVICDSGCVTVGGMGYGAITITGYEY